jgi:hypothetical protein
MNINIDDLSEDELIDLNRQIIERLKFMRKIHNHVEMMRFYVGQKVSFQPAGRERQLGVLVKYNQKTVTVITEGGQQWKVSPQLLSPVKDVNTPDGKPGNVIEMESIK